MPASFGSVIGADGQVYTRTSEPDWLLNSNKHLVAASSIDLAYAKNSTYSPTSIPTYGPAGGVSAASLGYAAPQRQLTGQIKIQVK